MNVELLFEPMFRIPLTTGLLLAAVLPLLGLYLRLRNEWLAALGFAHVAGAGGVLAPIIGAPVLVGALVVGAAAALAKGAMRGRGNDFYVLLILLGWSGMLLGAAFSHHAQIAAQALMDGQLYFISVPQLIASLLLAVAVAIALQWQSRILLRERLFPWHDHANGRAIRLHGILFDLLVGLAIALAATALGVMAAFALIFIPAWIMFLIAPGWRWALAGASALAVSAYLIAFTAAVLLDLPFGPALVVVLALAAPARLLARH